MRWMSTRGCRARCCGGCLGCGTVGEERKLAGVAVGEESRPAGGGAVGEERQPAGGGAGRGRDTAGRLG